MLCLNLTLFDYVVCHIIKDTESHIGESEGEGEREGERERERERERES